MGASTPETPHAKSGRIPRQNETMTLEIGPVIGSRVRSPISGEGGGNQATPLRESEETKRIVREVRETGGRTETRDDIGTTDAEKRIRRKNLLGWWSQHESAMNSFVEPRRE